MYLCSNVFLVYFTKVLLELQVKGNIFELHIHLNMCFGCSKELSHWDCSFEYPQHIFCWEIRKLPVLNCFQKGYTWLQQYKGLIIWSSGWYLALLYVFFFNFYGFILSLHIQLIFRSCIVLGFALLWVSFICTIHIIWIWLEAQCFENTISSKVYIKYFYLPGFALSLNYTVPFLAALSNQLLAFC